MGPVIKFEMKALQEKGRRKETQKNNSVSE